MDNSLKEKENWEKCVPVSHPWVCVDLDGCLMEDGYFPHFGPPRAGAILAMEILRKSGVKIMIFTARTGITDLDGKYQNVNQVVEDIYRWAEKYDVHIDYVWPMPKPTFVLAFFDDRAIHLGKGVHAWPDSIVKFGEMFPNLADWKINILPPLVGVSYAEEKGN